MILLRNIGSILLIVFGVLYLTLGQSFAKEFSDSPAEIPIALVSQDVYLRLNTDPSEEQWRRVPEYAVTLNMAPPMHQLIALRHTGEEKPVTAGLSVVSDGQRLSFRLRWQDDTLDEHTKVGRYSDAAALQFPLTEEDSSIMMGSTGSQVGLWYWRADREGIEALVATGPGTVSRSKDVTLAGLASHRRNPETGQDDWYLVMSKELRHGEEHGVSFDRQKLPLALALWQGHDNERDGLKRVSDWLTLDLANLGKKL